MSFSIRTTALAAALCTFACGSFAETVSISFSNLDAGVDSPVALTAVKGFKVSGAYLHDFRLLKENVDFYDQIDLDFPAKVDGGFLLNTDAKSGSKTPNIVFSTEEVLATLTKINGVDYAGREILGVSYRAWGLGVVKAVGSNGKNESRTVEQSGVSGPDWTGAGGTFNGIEGVSRIEFSADGGLFGIQSLDIMLAPDAPTNVPEPGSYALVGLALVAAGAARRRRA